VQKKTIEHPFHKITIEYDETKPWTPRDEKLLNIYLQLHDAEARQHEIAFDLLKKYGEHGKHIEALRKELKTVREKLNSTREMADHVLGQLSLKVPNALENFVQSVNATNDMIQEYDKKLRELEVESRELNVLKEKYHDEEEDNQLWERLSELKITYAYDNNLSIDYVSFDDDEERFREKASYISHQNDNYMNSCDRTIENYNRLVVETEVQYEVWKEFCKRMALIEYITNRDAGFSEVSSN